MFLIFVIKQRLHRRRGVVARAGRAKGGAVYEECQEHVGLQGVLLRRRVHRREEVSG